MSDRDMLPGFASWKKSTFSYLNGDCVEVAGLSGKAVMVRDSKDIDGPVLNFTPAGWSAFIGGLRSGR